MLIRFAEWLLRTLSHEDRTYFVVDHHEGERVKALQYVGSRLVNRDHVEHPYQFRVRWL